MLNAQGREQVINAHPDDISPEYQPDGRLSSEVAHEMIALAHKNNFHRFEWMHKTLEGDAFLCEVTLTKVIIDDEMMLHVVWRDLTVQRRSELAVLVAQKELCESEERFDLAIKGSNIGIWDWNPDARRSVYSVGFSDILGLDKHSNDGNDLILAQALRPAYQDLYFQALRTLLKSTGKSLEFEGEIERHDGHRAWVRVLGQALRDEKGHVTRVLGSIVDITRQKQVEETLLNHQEHLEELVEDRTIEVKNAHNLLVSAINSIESGFILYDPGGVVKLSNTQFGTIYSLPEEAYQPGFVLKEMLKNFSPYMSAEDIEQREKDVLSANPEDMHKLPNGRTVKVSRSKTEQGDIIAVISDVSDFINQEELLKEQACELEQALSSEKELNELQRQFVSMASHEFRTPLAIIDSSAQRIKRQATNLNLEDVQGRIENIRGAVKRMVTLMESTLSIARIDAGKLKISMVNCDFRSIILEVLIRQMEMDEASRITCDLKDLPEEILGDGALLDQVFTNLLSNAVKYSPETPEIHVRGWCEGASVVVSVRDNGLGIDEDDLPGMFKRFFRAKTSAGISGTGIGLNLVKMIVEGHKGTINVESRVGEGTTFIIKLPIGQVDQIPMAGRLTENGDAARLIG